MNITSPIDSAAIDSGGPFGGSVTSLLQTVHNSARLFDDGPDGGLGLAMAALSGIAAALALAIVLSVYFRSGARSPREMVKHGIAAAIVLGLIVFVIYDMRHAAQAFLGIRPLKPAIELEIRPSPAALTSIGDTPT